MKTGYLLAFSIASSLSLQAIPTDNELRKMVLDNGIEAFPKSQKELAALAEKSAPESKNNKSTPAKIELGKKLYFDPRLSASNLISCNTCHNLALGGVDLVPVAIGHKWAANHEHLNSPTVYNSVFNEVQFYDGRAAHLSEQAQGPMENQIEMASSRAEVERRINSIPAYVAEFKKSYGADTKVSFELIADTIGVFERTLVTPSPFDDYMNGSNSALDSKQKEGLVLFIETGCATCHGGVNLGGSMQPFNIAREYKYTSLGGFKGDKDGRVKTPTLRNIAQTPPYFHNGAIWKLTDAVKEMASVQLGIELDDVQADKITAFLHSLTGRKPKIEYPQLPDSTDETPTPTFD
ncbi:cytochrome-c peroxidase [Helicobacter sp. 10-6591]|uniref:cytochrome-c peroxidase n=1 Tax=Helicobacter sp. 10-6591 TaxID=2004998 RepID=UPI000DCD1AC1|nr:cytochrome-c peroxidase [Helicobacter sp. 10-6591]MCI7485672.1 cytochrome-c peroxidase [Helicobacter sp.]RAX55702.1 cytochrome C biogenesis protein CcsA [Helicobacter sp. 10-6591]